MVRKILLTIISILVIIMFLYVGVGVLFGQSSDTDQLPIPFAVETLTEEEVSLYDFSLPTPSPKNVDTSKPDLKQTAWIPDWDFERGYASFVANADYFDSISPVWYSLTSAGEVSTNRVGYDRIQSFTNSRGIKLIPSIASFDADELHRILNDDKKLSEHISFLKNEITTYDYDGLDIDYESIYYEDQAEFLKLVRNLFEFLDSKGKTLSVAVMPKWSDSDIFDSLRQTREAQDWYELGQIVHELRIMTYNVTSYQSTYPGPVAPFDWLQATLRYAITKVDPEKIILGLPLYGYDGWSNNPTIPNDYFGLVSGDLEEKGQADAVTYGQVAGITSITSNSLDRDSLEKVLRYNLNGKQYIVFYPDLDSTRFRVDLAQDMGIGGIAYWRMGDEDTRVYALID